MSQKHILYCAPFLLFAYFSPAAAGALTDVEVIDRTSGETLPLYSHRGKVYVAGKPGNRYSINIHNKSDGRIMSIVSVDGVNAVSGATADTLQQGYVLSPWSAAEIAGWRKNLDEVAAFYFTSLSDSYAGRTGRPQNVGVIGVAVYQEDLPVIQPLEVGPQADAASPAGRAKSAPSAPAANSSREGDSFGASSKPMAKEEAKIGTGHGERVASPTQYTSFKRLTKAPAEVITIYYDSRANLIAQGVIPSAIGRRPNPFPGSFVADPEG